MKMFALLAAAKIPAKLENGKADPGVLVFDDADLGGALQSFVDALAQHRHFDRETDPPRV